MAAPSAAHAGSTQTFDSAVELLKQPPGGSWESNFILGATFGTDDGTPVSPVRRMQMSFPTGSRFNAEAFKVCPSFEKMPMIKASRVSHLPAMLRT